MIRRACQQVFGLFLGLILATGINLSAIQVDAMAIGMATSSDMVSCDCHGGCNESDTTSVDCLSVCMTASPALLVPESAMEKTIGPEMALSVYRSIGGPIAALDPYPPKSSDLM